MRPDLRPLALMISLIGAGAAHGERVTPADTPVVVLDDGAPGESSGAAWVTAWVPGTTVTVARAPAPPVTRRKVRRFARRAGPTPAARPVQEAAIERTPRLVVALSPTPASAVLATSTDRTPLAEPDATPAPGHAARVLAMLAGVPEPAPTEPVEDGPAKRARKVATRAARAALAAGVVDLPLPLDTETPPHAAPFGDAAPPVAAATLDGVRGGYSGGGLNVSFGIERAVYVNGALMTTTSFNVVSGGAGASAAIDAAATALVQNGAGNQAHAGTLGSNTAGTVVQNSLDGQAIRSVTTINATVNSAGIYRGLNLGASLRGAVIDSLRR